MVARVLSEFTLTVGSSNLRSALKDGGQEMISSPQLSVDGFPRGQFIQGDDNVGGK